MQVLYFVPLFFLGMWVLIPYLISRMGWHNLMDKYLYEQPFEGKRIGMISASINSANYNNAIVMKCNEQGFYLKMVWMFRLFHKPVFIPWTEIKQVRSQKILFWNTKELIIGDPFVAIIKLRENTYREFEAYIPQTVVS